MMTLMPIREDNQAMLDKVTIIQKRNQMKMLIHQTRELTKEVKETEEDSVMMKVLMTLMQLKAMNHKNKMVWLKEANSLEEIEYQTFKTTKDTDLVTVEIREKEATGTMPLEEPTSNMSNHLGQRAQVEEILDIWKIDNNSEQDIDSEDECIY